VRLQLEWSQGRTDCPKQHIVQSTRTPAASTTVL
jgi:hypothetical protein